MTDRIESLQIHSIVPSTEHNTNHDTEAHSAHREDEISESHSSERRNQHRSIRAHKTEVLSIIKTTVIPSTYNFFRLSAKVP